MSFSPLITRLVETLRRLPGVGPKSAQRMAFHLLERDREGGVAIAEALQLAMRDVGHCKQCRTFSETELCHLCSNPARDTSLLCVLETPADIVAIEHSATYRGLYFVLMGHLSPLDGVGPEQIGIPQLQQQLSTTPPRELILATNPTVEGEATAFYIAQIAQKMSVQTSRIAHGVPLGSELEYIDSGTLANAFTSRREILLKTEEETA